VESFSDDPLRMLRAARFLSRYGLTPADGLVDAARALVDRMEIVSGERIRDELFRLLQVEDPTAGFALLDDMGLLPVVLPEVAALTSPIREVLERQVAAADSGDAVLRLGLLVHGAGGRESLGRWSSAFRLSGREVGRIGTLLDGAAMLAESGPDGSPSDEEIRRLAARVGDQLDEVLTFAALVGVGPDGPALDRAVARLRGLGELDDLGPGMDGATVMRLLNLEAGPGVGEVMAWLGELRLTGGRLDDAEIRRRLLDRWGTSGG